MNTNIVQKRSLAEIIAEKKALQQQQKATALFAEESYATDTDNSSTLKTVEAVKQKTLKEILEAAKLAKQGTLDSFISNKTPIETRLAVQHIADLNNLKETAEGQDTSDDSQSRQLSSQYISDHLSHLLYCLNQQDMRASTEDLDKLTVEERITYFKQEQYLDRLSRENLKPYQTEAMQVSQAVAEAIVKEESNETFSLSIVLNKEQQLAKELAFTGKSFVLTGPAGTGKTTAQREIASELLRQNQLGTHSFRIQGTGEHVQAPSIAFVAYTRIASGNLRRAIHKDPVLEEVFQHNITTVHNLLEYTPETYWDYETNSEKFRFIPRRNASNPLDITHLIIEEATMIGVADLWPRLYEALRPDVQIIFIGDINQLQPVFGASVFNYALTQLPVVELTKVYRQKEGSSILDNAHRILRGEFPLIEDANFKIVRGGTVQHTQPKLAQSLGATIPKWAEVGEYDPDQDIILSPWNKHDLGTDNLNKIVAQFLGDKRDAVVWEIICGISKLYLAVGDRVLFNKQVGTITKIGRNYDYVGKQAKPESKNLLRFGAYRGAIDSDDSFELEGYENLDIDKMMDEEVPEKKRQASHFVELEMETGITERLSAVGDFSPQVFSLGYALTVHKAQGCEWRKVFIVLHKDHSISAHRELFYTAVTRSREQCVIIAKDFMIEKAIKAQKIKGNSVAEKIAYFNSGITLDANIRCTKP